MQEFKPRRRGTDENLAGALALASGIRLTPMHVTADTPNEGPTILRRVTPLLVAAVLACAMACTGVARAASSGGAALGPSASPPTGGAAPSATPKPHKPTKRVKRSASTKSSHPSSSHSTPSGSTGAQVLAFAKRFTGTPYVLGGNGPHTFDCSGFTSYVFAHFGYHLNRSSYAQMLEGRAVHGTLEVGDLVFWDDGGHVGIYAGNDTFISATVHRGIWTYSFAIWSQTQTWTTARRILGDTALTAPAATVSAARDLPRNGGPADATP